MNHNMGVRHGLMPKHSPGAGTTTAAGRSVQVPAAQAPDLIAETARALLATLAPGGRVVVGIDGRSGSGKTTLAARVRERLAARQDATPNTVALEVEEHIPGWRGLVSGIGYVGTLAEHLAAQGFVQARVWDWGAGNWRARTERVPTAGHADVVFIVGCGAISPAIREHLDFAVWCEASEEVRRQRVAARDPYNWEAYWQVWANQETELLERTAPADLIVA